VAFTEKFYTTVQVSNVKLCKQIRDSLSVGGRLIGQLRVRLYLTTILQEMGIILFYYLIVASRGHFPLYFRNNNINLHNPFSVQLAFLCKISPGGLRYCFMSTEIFFRNPQGILCSRRIRVFQCPVK